MSFKRGARSHGGFPKPGDELKDVSGRHSREGWLHVTDHSSVYLAGKQYRDMKEWHRPCAVCGTKFSVFEKTGTVDANSRFSNRTCDAHRNLLAAVEKGYITWSPTAGGMVAGSACVGGNVTVNAEEAEKLHMANSVMKEELDGLYARNKELFLEIEALTARNAELNAELLKIRSATLAVKAQYELQPAMEAQAAFDPHALLAADIATKNKMPWEN